MLQGTSLSETREAAREVKFMVPLDVAARILEWSRSRLSPDPYAGGDAGDEYRTTSLYFDTEDLAVYHRRGSYRRSKYRVRRYGTSEVVFLERKLRTAHLLNKRRTVVPITEMPKVGEDDLAPAWSGHWFAQRILARRVVPVCQVSYHRHARVGTGAHGPVRLTLDNTIRALPTAGLRFVSDPGWHVLESQAIVEMKFRVDMPAVFKQLAETFRIQPTAVSKYRLAMDRLRQEQRPIAVVSTPTVGS